MYYRKSSYVSPYNMDQNESKANLLKGFRDTVLSTIFYQVHFVVKILLVLVVLNFCKVTNLNWWLLAGVYIVYLIVDTMSIMLQDYLEYRDRKKAREIWEKEWTEWTKKEAEKEEELAWGSTDAYQDYSDD